MKPIFYAAAVSCLLFSACASTPVQTKQVDGVKLMEKCMSLRPESRVFAHESDAAFSPPVKHTSKAPAKPSARSIKENGPAEACIATTVSVEGKLTDPLVLHSNNDDWTENALDSLESWTLVPATLNGEAVEASYMLAVHYTGSGR